MLRKFEGIYCGLIRLINDAIPCIEVAGNEVKQFYCTPYRTRLGVRYFVFTKLNPFITKNVIRLETTDYAPIIMFSLLNYASYCPYFLYHS